MIGGDGVVDGLSAELIVYILGMLGLGAAGKREGKRIENRLTKLEAKKPKKPKGVKGLEVRVKHLEKNSVSQASFDRRVEKKETETNKAISEVNDRLRHIEAQLTEFKDKVFEKFLEVR